MPFRTKLAIALRLLDAKGIRYSASIYRLLWSLNVPLRPPLFNGFARNFFFMSIFSGAGWGALMWLLLWSHQGITVAAAVMAAAAFGVFFGGFNALLLRCKARAFFLKGESMVFPRRGGL